MFRGKVARRKIFTHRSMEEGRFARRGRCTRGSRDEVMFEGRNRGHGEKLGAFTEDFLIGGKCRKDGRAKGSTKVGRYVVLVARTGLNRRRRWSIGG